MTAPDPVQPVTRVQGLLEHVFGSWTPRRVVAVIVLLATMLTAGGLVAVYRLESWRNQQEFLAEATHMQEQVQYRLQQRRALLSAVRQWVLAMPAPRAETLTVWPEAGSAWLPRHVKTVDALLQSLALEADPDQVAALAACLRAADAAHRWQLCQLGSAAQEPHWVLVEALWESRSGWVVTALMPAAEPWRPYSDGHFWEMQSVLTSTDAAPVWPEALAANATHRIALPITLDGRAWSLKVAGGLRQLTTVEYLYRHAAVWLALVVMVIAALVAMQGYLMLISTRRRASGARKQMDAALQKEQTRRAAVMDAAPDAIVMVDSQGKITWCNVATVSIFGRPSDALMGLPIADTLLPALAATSLDQWFDEHGFSNRVIGLDTVGQRAEGTVFPVALSAARIFLDGEQIYSFIVRDTTDAKWAEQELALRDRALASSSDGVIIVSMTLPSHPIIYANSGFEQITGYEVHEVLGLNPRFLHGTDADQPGLTVLRQAIKEGRRAQTVMRNYRKNGSLYYIELSISPVLNQEGVLTHFIGIQADISDRVAAEQVLRLRTERLNAVFDLSPDGFVVLDKRGEVTIVNPAFEAMTGMSAADMVGQSRDVFEDQLMSQCQSREDETSDSDKDADRNAYTTRELLHLHTPCQRTLVRRIRHGGSHDETVMYFRDVTHEREVDRMKSEFLAMAAHELRTPMVSIFGFTELLLKRQFKDEHRKDMLETIHRQASILINLVNELLDLARIEARRGKDFNRSRQALQGVIEQALGALLVNNDDRKVKVTLPEEPLMLDVDRSKLSQALTNVLSNAYKYSPNGGEISLDVLCRRRGTQAEVGIRVEDHGMGMTEAQLAKVFERFFRADTSGNIPGTGLGMTIVKEIIELHGGEVVVDSTFGQGTTVTMWLPMKHLGSLPEQIKVDEVVPLV